MAKADRAVAVLPLKIVLTVNAADPVWVSGSGEMVVPTGAASKIGTQVTATLGLLVAAPYIRMASPARPFCTQA